MKQHHSFNLKNSGPVLFVYDADIHRQIQCDPPEIMHGFSPESSADPALQAMCGSLVVVELHQDDDICGELRMDAKLPTGLWSEHNSKAPLNLTSGRLRIESYDTLTFGVEAAAEGTVLEVPPGAYAVSYRYRKDEADPDKPDDRNTCLVLTPLECEVSKEPEPPVLLLTDRSPGLQILEKEEFRGAASDWVEVLRQRMHSFQINLTSVLAGNLGLIAGDWLALEFDDGPEMTLLYLGNVPATSTIFSVFYPDSYLNEQAEMAAKLGRSFAIAELVDNQLLVKVQRTSSLQEFTSIFAHPERPKVTLKICRDAPCVRPFVDRSHTLQDGQIEGTFAHYLPRDKLWLTSIPYEATQQFEFSPHKLLTLQLGEDSLRLQHFHQQKQITPVQTREGVPLGGAWVHHFMDRTWPYIYGIFVRARIIHLPRNVRKLKADTPFTLS